MIDAGQIRAARGLLEWKQKDVAERTGLNLQTIKRLESLGTGRSSVDTVMAVQYAFEAAGIAFIPENGGGAGVRLAKPKGSAK